MANRVVNTILNLKDNFSKGLNKISANTQNFKKQMRQVEMQGQQMRNSLSNAFSGISTAVGVAGVASLGALATTSVKTYASFEQSMSKVQALSGATGDDLKALTDKAEEMGAKTSKSAKECADALTYQALAGWDTNQMLKGLQPILRASEAGEMDLARCSDLVTDSMSAMGIKVDDLTGYLDVVTKAQASSNTSMEQMLEAYTIVGGTMKNLNVPLEESASILGVLANRSKKGAEAGNALSSILVNLTGGSSAAKGAMDELGISAWDSKGNFIGLKNTLVKLSDSLSKCTQEQKTNFEAAIGGKTQLDTLQAMIAGVSEEYDGLNEKLQDSKGYMEQTAEIMQKNLIGRLNSLKSAFEAVQVKIGRKFAPTLMAAMENITDKLLYLSQNIDGVFDRIGSTINKFKPIIFGLIAGFGGFMIITKVISLFVLFKSGIKKLAAISILSNPVMLIAIAIGGLVAMITHLMNTNEEFRNNMINVFNGIRDTCSNALQKVVDWINNIKVEYGSFSNFLQSKMGVIAGVAGVLVSLLAYKELKKFSGAINLVGGSFGKNISKILNFKNIFSTFKSIPSMVLKPFKLISSGITSLKRSFVLMKAFLPSIVGNGGLGMLKGVLGAAAHPIKTLSGGFKILRGALGGLISPFGLIIAAVGLLVAGFIYCWNTNEQFREKMISTWNSIAPVISNVVNLVIGWVSGLINFLMSFYAEHKGQIQEFLGAIFDAVGIVIMAIADTIVGLIDIIGGVFDFINALIHGDWSAMWESCKNIFKSAIDLIKGWWESLRELFSKPLKAIVNVFKKDKGSDETGDVEKVDQNATGTHYFGGGWTTVGEHGTELMKLPSGTQIKSNSQSQKAMSSGGGVQVNLTIQGNVIGNDDFANYVGGYIWSKIKNDYGNM